MCFFLVSEFSKTDWSLISAKPVPLAQGEYSLFMLQAKQLGFFFFFKPQVYRENEPSVAARVFFPNLIAPFILNSGAFPGASDSCRMIMFFFFFLNKLVEDGILGNFAYECSVGNLKKNESKTTLWLGLQNATWKPSLC